MNSGLFTLPLASLDGPPPPSPGSSCAMTGTCGSFVAGEENAVLRVLAAAVGRSELPYNPIVLHGSLGVGKSSVAHALAALHRDALALSSGKMPRIIATSAADLARALAHAVETASTDELRSNYQNCDLLLIDDLHRLAKRPAAQQFLITVIDVLRRQDVLVLATLRRPPQATPGLLPKLTSRLAGGLVVSLSPPGYEARCELARQTAARAGLRLPDADIQRIAHSRGGLSDRVLTAGKIQEAVYNLVAKRRFATPDPESAFPQNPDEADACKRLCRTAAAIVARHYGVPAAELKRATRRKTVAAARALAMYLVRALSDASYATIGKHFGGRDHTTVMYACRKLAAAVENDALLCRSIDDLAIQIAAEALP